MTCHASPIKRNRATKAEMEERAEFLLDYARRHAPVTVRQLFYAATVASLPGIEKIEGGYNKVQAQVLDLRQSGRMPYGHIADGTRWMIRDQVFNGVEDALHATAEAYRKNLWADHEDHVEIWLEKDALAGVLHSVTSEYCVALAPTRGYTSETFAHSTVWSVRGTGKRLCIYALYDFDRSGQDAARSLRDKVERFGDRYEVEVEFALLGLTAEQVHDLGLPTRPPKRTTAADARWPHDCAAELDAIPPDTLRDMVRDAIEDHLPAHELDVLKLIEADEREQMRALIGEAVR